MDFLEKFLYNRITERKTDAKGRKVVPLASVLVEKERRK